MNARKLTSITLTLVLAFAWSTVNGQRSTVRADDFVPAEDSVPANSSPTYILDSGDSGGNITLQFGTTLAEILEWDSANLRFNISAPLSINGDVITSAISNAAGNINIQPAGADTGNVQIGTGGAGTATPDYLAMDVKSTTGDPAGGAEGYMYYNTFDNKFRCYEGVGWKDCDTSGGSASLQTAYGNGATITTAGAVPIAFTLTSGGFNITGTGATAIGNNAGTVAVNSTTWDISAAGVASGLTGLTTTGTVSLGNNTGTVTIDSSDWDISATGAMTGIGAITMDGLLTGTLGATLSGAIINLNNNSNFATNINTGTSTSAVNIGNVTGGVAIGGGTAIKRHLSGTGSLDFGATAARSCEALTLTVTGAADGDTVAIGVPNALGSRNVSQSFWGYVSAANTVTVKRCNVTNQALANPPAATIRADVWQH